MKFRFLVFASLLFLGACKSKKVTTAPTPPEPPKVVAANIDSAKAEPAPAFAPINPNPNVFATIRRTMCYGRCPAYEIIVNRDGSVLLNGIANVPHIGWFKANIKTEALEELKSKAREIGYQKLADKYPLDGKFISDLPSCITYMRYDGHEKQIVNRHGAPQELIDFERYFDSLFENINWVKTEPPSDGNPKE